MPTENTTCPGTSESELLARRRTLVDQQTQTNVEIAEIDRQLSELCIHRWVWHPTAGEGRYCMKCKKDDLDCDD